MKLRTGFVSNSSSSSFVIMTTKENFDKVLAEADEYTKKVIAELGTGEEEFLGKKIITITTWNGMNGDSPFDDMGMETVIKKGEETDGREPYEAFEEFCTKLSKNKKEVVDISIDW